MALIVEDGTGLPNAESYASVAEADAYHAAYGNPSAWAPISTTQKELALRTATQYLEAVHNQGWAGDRFTDTQALAWPRSGVEDDGGHVLPEAPLPAALKNATAVMALKSLSETLLPDLSVDDASTVSSFSKRLGPLGSSVTFEGGRAQFKKYSLVEAMIRHLVRSRDTVERS